MEYDYLSLYNSEILNRRNFYYPPFYRLICITFKHLNKNVLDAAAEGVSSGLRASLKDVALILGPEYPAISRINNLYHKKTFIKISKKASITEIKSHIYQWINKLKSDNSYKQVRFNIDVDPQ
jgi:primosomal protein N' (replication factor Y)